MPIPNIHNMCLLMNQTVTRSRTFQSLSKLFGFLSIPLLNFFQPQLKCYLIDSLDWEPQHTNLYDYPECSETSLVNGKSLLRATSLEKPSSDFLSINFETLPNIRELVWEDEIIGFIGEFTEEENKSLLQFDIILIGKGKQLPCLQGLRPWSFSQIFVANNFTQYSYQTLFRSKQTLTLKFSNLQQITQALEIYERLLKQDYSSTLIKNILIKLNVLVSFVNGAYWLTINPKGKQQLAKKVISTTYNLEIESNRILINYFIDRLTLAEFIDMKKCPEKQAQYIPKFIRRIQEKKHSSTLQHKLSLSTQSQTKNKSDILTFKGLKEDSRKPRLLKEEEREESDIFESQSSQMMAKPQIVVVKSIGLGRLRSRSADFPKGFLQKQLVATNEKILEDIQTLC